eukprot:TRINITY_DN19249_c0_g1_i1.p1 TRINITY_DN19249_c0_g1~~TRINITY_DN19249_c0_g1_i1.p1  ORF type:complete len:227 (-),score=61.31 TRINITY_DN19249_c0_g1_i1:122-802(-)
MVVTLEEFDGQTVVDAGRALLIGQSNYEQGYCSEQGVRRVQKQAEKDARKVARNVKLISSQCIDQMNQEVKINCWQKGDSVNVTGKRIMVAIDGSKDTHRAITTAIAKANPGDHLFVVMAFKKFHDEWMSPAENTVISHAIWKEVANLCRSFEQPLIDSGFDYTLAWVPAKFSRKVLLVVLARQWKIQCLVMSKHRRDSMKIRNPLSVSFRSFFNSCYGACETIVV